MPDDPSTRDMIVSMDATLKSELPHIKKDLGEIKITLDDHIKKCDASIGSINTWKSKVNGALLVLAGLWTVIASGILDSIKKLFGGT